MRLFFLHQTAVRWLGLVLMALVLPLAAAPTADSNRLCLRCHALPMLAYHDPVQDTVINFAIDRAAFAASVHGELRCSECHQDDYQTYPHPLALDREALECVHCHQEHKKARRSDYAFAEIHEQFANSVHATRDHDELADFRCHSCHNPHRFAVSRIGKALAEIVRDDNAVCLGCHEQMREPLRQSHAWLPNREAHWAAARCIDCHTPLEAQVERVSHQILPAADSQPNCVNCHSQNRQLLNRLYAYRAKADIDRDGLLAQALFNEAYVVGMSRSPTLDRLALLVLGLTVLGLAAHGYGRYRAYQKIRGVTE